jgi:hypothetical protein
VRGRECCNLDGCLFCGEGLKDPGVRQRSALGIDILVVVKRGEVEDLEKNKISMYINHVYRNFTYRENPYAHKQCKLLVLDLSG